MPTERRQRGRWWWTGTSLYIIGAVCVEARPDLVHVQKMRKRWTKRTDQWRSVGWCYSNLDYGWVPPIQCYIADIVVGRSLMLRYPRRWRIIRVFLSADSISSLRFFFHDWAPKGTFSDVTVQEKVNLCRDIVNNRILIVCGKVRGGISTAIYQEYAECASDYGVWEITILSHVASTRNNICLIPLSVQSNCLKFWCRNFKTVSQLLPRQLLILFTAVEVQFINRSDSDGFLPRVAVDILKVPNWALILLHIHFPLILNQTHKVHAFDQDE